MIAPYSLLVFFAFGSLFSCDIIKKEQVYEQPAPPDSLDLNRPARKIFLEIFTGFKCANCPEQTKIGIDGVAAAKLESKTIVMKIHSGFFAQPSGKIYKLDFRTIPGTALTDKFNIQGYPSGVINRKKYASSYSVSPLEWKTKISLEPVNANVDIKINKVYESANRNLKISVTSTLYSNMINKLNSKAYILEDSVLYWQIDNGEDIENFVHRHVLRDEFSSLTGNDLFAANANKGTKASKEFTPYTLKPDWTAKHCEVIVIITDAATGEVLQVEKKKVIE